MKRRTQTLKITTQGRILVGRLVCVYLDQQDLGLARAAGRLMNDSGV